MRDLVLALRLLPPSSNNQRDPFKIATNDSLVGEKLDFFVQDRAERVSRAPARLTPKRCQVSEGNRPRERSSRAARQRGWSEATVRAKRGGRGWSEATVRAKRGGRMRGVEGNPPLGGGEGGGGFILSRWGDLVQKP